MKIKVTATKLNRGFILDIGKKTIACESSVAIFTEIEQRFVDELERVKDGKSVDIEIQIKVN